MRQYGQGWRLINDLPAMGAYHMAVDQALMHSVGTDETPPTLRFYRWTPACISLGYGQRIGVIDKKRLLDYGYQVVRRPTGGGAILHDQDLTYSVILPLHHPLAQGSIIESYRRLSAAFVEALGKLGVNPQVELQGETVPQTSVCFETASHYEPTINGKKLIGSAQARKFSALLQHGSIPLAGDIAAICDVMAYSSEMEREQDRQRVRLRACTLTDVLHGRIQVYDEVANALVSGFETALGIAFEAGAMTESEQQTVQKLQIEKYGNVRWTERR